MRLFALLKLLSAFLPERKYLLSLIYKDMRRLVTVDKVAVCFRYYVDEKEVGQINYNMQEGHFFVFSWPPSFSAINKAYELIKILRFAIRVIESEKCS